MATVRSRLDRAATALGAPAGALASAALVALSFERELCAPLALVAATPALVAAHAGDGREGEPRALRVASAWGAAYALATLLVLRFVPDVVDRFAHARPLGLALLAALGLEAGMRSSACALAATLIERRAGAASGALAFAAASFAVESFVPTLVPSGLGAPLVAVPGWAWLAAWGGAPALGALASLTGWASARALARSQDASSRARLGVAAMAWAVAAGLLLGGAVRARGGASETLRVGVVQLAPCDGCAPFERVARLRAEVSSAARAGAALVALPEGALPGERSADAAEALVQVALQGLEVDVVLGAVVEVAPSADAPSPRRNRVLARARDGSLARYDKERAFPLGERAPLEGTPIAAWFRRVSPRTGALSEGRGGQPFALAGGVVLPLVCYEDLLPGFVRARARVTDATLLVSLANDAWFDPSSAPRLHALLARARAVEAGRALVRATSTGLSGAWDRDGRVVGLLPSGADGAAVLDVPVDTRTTAYLAWGPAPFAAGLVLALGLSVAHGAVARRRRGRREAQPL